MFNDTTASMLDRCRACITGLAMGDAMGMPSQTLKPCEIKKHYGIINDFMAPYDGHPVAHNLRRAQITDDTEQTILLARRLLADRGKIDLMAWAHDLMAWEHEIKERGLSDILGPSTKLAVNAVVAGIPPSIAGRNGTTNGASMRIAPVGMITAGYNPVSLIDRVEEACLVSHNTREAIASASAVAAVVSLGIEGMGFRDALPYALDTARMAQTRGYQVGEANVVGCIERAVTLANAGCSMTRLAEATGVSVASHESISAAFGLVVMAGGDAWKTVTLAANIGDDTDTIGAIAGAMAGACSGMAGLPKEKTAILMQVNDLSLEELVHGMVKLRLDSHQSIVHSD